MGHHHSAVTAHRQYRSRRLPYGVVGLVFLTDYCEGLDQVRNPVTRKPCDHMDRRRWQPAPAWESAAR